MTKQELKEITDVFTEEEIIALKMGFPIAEDFGLNFVDDMEYDDFLSEEESYNFANSDVESETEFDNFLTKKSRERNKKRLQKLKDALKKKRDALLKSKKLKKIKESLKKVSLNNIRKATKKISLNNIGKGLNKIKNGVAKVALIAPRGAYLSLVLLNFRGYAYKLEAVLKNKSLSAKLKEKWEKLGGEFDKLVTAINKGKRKKPNFCGKKCQAKASEYSNFDPATLGVIIGLASTVVGVLGSIVNNAQVSKREKEAIDGAKAIQESQDKTLTSVEKARLEAQKQSIQAQADPRTLILNNPNLSPQEKQLALAQIDDVLGKDNNKKLIKYGVIGGIAIVGLIVIAKLFKNKRS